MSKDVLVAMDRSEVAENALEYALEEYPDGTIHVIHVTETNDPLDLFGARDPAEYMVAECDFEFDDAVMPDGNTFNRHQRRRAEAVIERACSLSDEYGRDIEPVVRSGHTVEEVISCAEARDADHIVIAEHCRTGLRPIVFGVPESVARKASRPVTIVC